MPCFVPPFPQGDAQDAGGTRGAQTSGVCEQAGCMHDPKTQGPPWGMQVMRELQLFHPTAPLGMAPQ